MIKRRIVEEDRTRMRNNHDQVEHWMRPLELKNLDFTRGAMIYTPNNCFRLRYVCVGVPTFLGLFVGTTFARAP